MELFLNSRTKSHVSLSFNLPTAYNAPGQDKISDEDDKEKVLVDPKTANINDLTQKQLEDIVNGWIRYGRKQIQMFKEKEPEDFTPMAEYTYWVEVESELNSILEQLRLEFVAQYLTTVRAGNKKYERKYNEFLSEMEKFHKQAKENSEYLLTIRDYLIVSSK